MLGPIHLFDSLDGLSRVLLRVHELNLHIILELIITELEEDVDPLIDLLKYGVKVGLSALSLIDLRCVSDVRLSL